MSAVPRISKRPSFIERMARPAAARAVLAALSACNGLALTSCASSSDPPGAPSSAGSTGIAGSAGAAGEPVSPPSLAAFCGSALTQPFTGARLTEARLVLATAEQPAHCLLGGTLPQNIQFRMALP